MAVALQVTGLTLLGAPAAQACHEVKGRVALPFTQAEGGEEDMVWRAVDIILQGRDPADAIDGVFGSPHHRVVTSSGDVGSSSCGEGEFGPASAPPGGQALSQAENQAIGKTYGIRLAKNATCEATGTYYDFLGGVGPEFVAPWHVPHSAPVGTDYVVCLTELHGGAPVADSFVAFAVTP
ncbi:MAG TPA: hypothetical protein VM142_10555 [Acidimicrobiales bacterium]|nr:hypothetical protein [Acidimicrobiales bacterium]